MEIFNQLIDEFSNIPHVSEWNELQFLFRRVALKKPKHWLLPLHICESFGENIKQAIPAILAVACSHLGIVLVDDMLDDDPRGEFVKLGKPAVANMASALQSAALTVISNCKVNVSSKLLVMESINEMFLATTIGQYWDVNSIIKDEESYWRIAKAKSSPFFGAAFQIGALMTGVSVEIALQVKELGDLYGEMIQIHDDVDDSLSVPAKPDWDESRSPLPILFASIVNHPNRIRFEQLRPNASNNLKALEEAQEILIQCGAISYCMYQLLGRYEIVKEKISMIKIKRKESLEKVFDDIVQPVFQLFNEIDSPRTAVGAR